MFRVLARSVRSFVRSDSPRPAVRPAMIEGLESRAMMSTSVPSLYTTDNRGSLFTMNVTTGATHVIGQMGVQMFDIAFSKSGQLYGVDSSSNLYKISTSTARVTRIGSVGFFVNALTFSSNGTLYAAGHSNFLKINTGTGHGTRIGTFSGKESAGDLAFDKNGTLYLTTTADTLVKVNVSTGHVKTVGSIGFSEVYGLAYYNGVMYGLSNKTEKAFKINLTTGHGTYTSFFGANVVGANGASFKF